MSTHAEFEIDYSPRIMVIDDEARIREACRVVLEDAGYEVFLAPDGKAGLQQIAAQHYDIILLDLMLPTLSGLEVLEKVSNRHPDTIVIVITGYATLEHSVEAMKKGAFDFIPKPFTPEHLRLVVAKAIDHTRALRDIANTHSRIRSLVLRLSDGVMCTNQQGLIVLANPAFLRMIGCKTQKAVGQSATAVIENPVLIDMIQKAWAITGKKTAEITKEITLRGRDESEEMILSAQCFPFRDRRGLNIGVITVLHEITALKQMDRMKSEFVSTVSHEIRSPMNSVLMQLRVILDGLAGDVTEKQHDILERAAGKINNLVQMATELLDLARIESGLIAQEREAVQMDEVIREQVDTHRPQAESKGVALTLKPIPQLPPLFVHRRNMEEVLGNLIGNAIKYTASGGQVDVSARADGEYLFIQVSDTGFGIDAADIDLIFRRFYRVKDQQTRYIQGTGLGLAIVKSIVEAHQGRIEVQSTPGIGSTFTVLLPLIKA